MNFKFKYSIAIFIGLILMSSCTRAQNASSQNEDMMNGKKVLIVYLSRTKNTQTIAEIIHEKVGGKLVELELKNPYPTNYKAIVAQVEKENETNFLPTLKNKIDSIQNYDIVFLGFPTWGMQLPTPMKSFLSQYNLSGKTIIPFNTNAGYGLGSTIQTIKQLSPNSKIFPEYSTKGGIERDGVLFVMQGDKLVQVKEDISKWLHQLGFTNTQNNQND